MSLEPVRCLFPSTHWTLVAQAGADDTQRLRALGQLLERYLPAMRAYLLARFRFAEERAEDVLQGFLADKVLEEDIVRKADRAKGRFRAFLVVALYRYTLNHLRAERAAERVLEAGRVQRADEALAERAARAVPDPIDTAWAEQVIDQALRKMRQECDAGGRADVWNVFEARVLTPAMHRPEPGPGPEPLADVARRLGTTSSRTSNLLVTAKRMFARNLRAVVGGDSMREREVEAEIRRLRAVLGG